MSEIELTLDDLPALAAGEGFWYLGSPYSKYPSGIDAAAGMIEQIAGELIRRQVRLFCPIAHSHHIAMTAAIDPYCHKTWMFQDEAIMHCARGIIVAKMRTWESSYGLTLERQHFTAAGKPVSLLDPKLLF